MSLVICAKVSDGIVLAADSRGTVRDVDGHTMYTDDVVKIVPFPNRIAIAQLGEDLANDVSTENFLYRYRDNYGATSQINSLPLDLLDCAVVQYRSENAAMFVVAGYASNRGSGHIYLVDVKQRRVDLVLPGYTAGAVSYGCPDVADAIAGRANYLYMPLDGCVKLLRGAVDATIAAYKHRSPQGVGGRCYVYTITADGSKTGWWAGDDIIRDPAAPDDAYDKIHREDIQREVSYQLEKARKDGES